MARFVDISLGENERLPAVVRTLRTLFRRLHELLHVNALRVGNITKLDHDGSVTCADLDAEAVDTEAFTMATGATAGYVLGGDADGVASWVSAGAAGAGGATTNVQYNTAGALDGEAAFAYTAGTNTLVVANIDTDAIDAAAITMATGAGAEQVLTSDSAGVASWEDPAYAYKTGWEVTAAGTPTVTISLSTRTITLAKVSADVDYWVNGIKYTLSTNKTVEFTDTEGVWYIYLVGDTLTASQTAWTFDGTKCFVATLYWDAVNNEVVGGVLNELHSWQFPERLHEYLHETFGTRWYDGLGVSDAGSDNLNVAAGEIYDEDIEIEITDDAGSGTWDQTLSPLDARILYRSGATGLWRQFASSAVPVYLDTNVLQINDPDGGGAGVWGWTAVTLNKFCAYWVVAGTAQGEPVFIIPGQEEGVTLNAAIAGNSLSDMDFGELPVAEHKALARVICQRIAGSPYYAISQIDDYRNVADEPKFGGSSASDHGGLSGLADDDHTQYVLADGTRAMTSLTVGNITSANGTETDEVINIDRDCDANPTKDAVVVTDSLSGVITADGHACIKGVVDINAPAGLSSGHHGLYGKVAYTAGATVGQHHAVLGETDVTADSSAVCALKHADGQTASLPTGVTTALLATMYSSSASLRSAAYTACRNANTGEACGFWGYGFNTKASGGGIGYGLLGFGSSTSGLAVGVKGYTAARNPTSFGLVSHGHAHVYDGSLRVFASAAPVSVADEDHVAETDDGSLYVENMLEVDGVLYADGGAVVTGDLTVTGELKGARCCFDGAYNGGAFSASRYLALNNGMTMTATRGHMMLHNGSITAIGGTISVASYTPGATVAIQAMVNGTLAAATSYTIAATGQYSFNVQTAVRGSVPFSQKDILSLYVYITGTAVVQYPTANCEVQFDT